MKIQSGPETPASRPLSIALAPSYSCAHEDRAIFLALTGRRAEALAEITKINQLDYGFSAAHTESRVYYELLDYPNLIEASRRGLLLDPNDWFQHYMLGVLKLRAGWRKPSLNTRKQWKYRQIHRALWLSPTPILL